MTIVRELRESLGAVRAVWSNDAVRGAQLALAGSTVGDWSYGVTVSVLVYQRAGVDGVGIVQACRMVPAAIAAPFLAALVDRFPKQRVLFVTDAVRAAIMAGLLVSTVVASSLPILVALVIAAELVATMFWPAHGALLPTLVHEPAELTAANVTQSTVASTGVVVGPVLGAAAIGLLGSSAALAVPIAAYALSAVAVTRVRPREPEPHPEAEASGVAGLDSQGRGVLLGLSAILRHAEARVLIGLYGAQVVVCGALNVLTVVAALQLLHAGAGGVGVLLGAIGVGGLLGAIPALALSRSTRLSTLFVCGLLLWGPPIALIGLVTNLPSALILFALLGAGNTLVDVSAMTLLQRGTPSELLGRVFGVLESILIASLGVGAALTPLLIHLVGARGAFLVTGAVLPLVALPLWRRLRGLDAPTYEPRRIDLLRGDAIFAPLPEAILEHLASSLQPVSLAAGQTLFHEGDVGDNYYLIDQGNMRIVLPGHEDSILGPSQGFGEIALIRGIPRTATATAQSTTALFALRGDEFVSAVIGHATSTAAADAVIASRLLTLRPALASV